MVHVNSEHRAAACEILANTEQQDVRCYFCTGGNSVAGYKIKGLGVPDICEHRTMDDRYN